MMRTLKLLSVLSPIGRIYVPVWHAEASAGFPLRDTYLVQEQRAAFRLMEITFLGTVSTCERSFYVSEER